MKQSVVALSALAAVVAAQEPTQDGPEPHFLNESFEVVEGEPFTLLYDNCEGGCTIVLQTGPTGNLGDVTVLEPNATGDEASVTINDVPSGDYNFYIINNESGLDNYSDTFEYEGEGELAPTTTRDVSTVAETTTMEEETTTVATTTVMTTATVETETTESAESTETEDSTSTEEESATTTAEDDSEETEAPDGAAGHLGSPMGLVAAALALIAIF